jgi:hypothetical protein
MGEAEIGKMLQFKSNLDDMYRGFDLNTKLQDLEGVPEIRDEKGEIIVKGKIGKILENQTNQSPYDSFFPDNTFQLDAERDALRADIQDYNRVGTPRRITNYFLSDKGTKGANASALADLLVRQDQLKDAGTGGVLPRIDKRVAKNLKQTQYGIENLLNPPKLTRFGQAFIDATPGEQSYFMGRTDFMEGGIASLNVKK